MGFAQKGGAVLSFVRLCMGRDTLHQARIDTQQADAILVCDLVVGASMESLQTIRHGHTQIVANTHKISTHAIVKDADAQLHEDALMEKLKFAAGAHNLVTCNGQALARQLFGDTLTANILLMGFAWQRGLIPVGLPALERAIELNGVAVEANKMAFGAGRLAAHDPKALQSLLGLKALPAAAPPARPELPQLVEQRSAFLTNYQGPALARHYQATVAAVQARESEVFGAGAPLLLTQAVARCYAKLLAYKDEYEVARLYSDGEFARQLQQQFEGDFKLAFHMAPPLLVRPSRDGVAPKKVVLGAWMAVVLKVLAKARFLRGTPLDIFGWTQERRLERQLIKDYAALLDTLLPRLARENLHIMLKLAELPDKIRGYGHVKLASIKAAKQREKALLAELDKPPADATLAHAAAHKAARGTDARQTIPIYVESR